jgi:hypothetical protein
MKVESALAADAGRSAASLKCMGQNLRVVMNFIYDERLLSERAAIWDMPSFLKAYTLHDSSLLEIRARPSADLLVFIDWDLYWNSVIPSQYNLLVIRFVMPYWAKWLQGSWHQPTLGGATSSVVLESEREIMLNDDRFDLRAFQGGKDEIQPPMLDASLTRTVFEFINWGECEILHGGEVAFACFDDAGHPWAIPFSDAPVQKSS